MNKQEDTDEIEKKDLMIQMARRARRRKVILDLEIEVHNFAARALNLLRELRQIDSKK